jgi:hypothetical protein
MGSPALISATEAIRRSAFRIAAELEQAVRGGIVVSLLKRYRAATPGHDYL